MKFRTLLVASSIAVATTLASSSAWAVTTVSNTNANSLAALLAGPGFTVTNATLTTDTTGGVGTFTDGAAATGIASGVVLTTGILTCVGSANTAPNCTGGGSFSTLSIDFTLAGGDLFFNYVFGSEEYLEFVGSQFNDTFALLLDGTNIATVPGGGGIVSINNVNTTSNSAFFRNNTGGGIPIEYDGLTTVLTASASGLGPGAHNLTFTITDVGDTLLDSGVFIQAGSIGNVNPGGVIPEPATWAMMLLGFGGLGAVMRSRRRAATATA
jgi:hypothetical protein